MSQCYPSVRPRHRLKPLIPLRPPHLARHASSPHSRLSRGGASAYDGSVLHKEIAHLEQESVLLEEELEALINKRRDYSKRSARIELWIAEMMKQSEERQSR